MNTTSVAQLLSKHPIMLVEYARKEKRMNQLLTQYYILKEDLLNGLAALN